MAQPNVQTVGKLGGEDLGGSVREDDPVAHTIGDIVHEVLAVGGIDVAVATVRHIIRALYLVLELIVHCLHMPPRSAVPVDSRDSSWLWSSDQQHQHVLFAKHTLRYKITVLPTFAKTTTGRISRLRR
uniref:Uncharacterized protein n=1 Tax=Anopheles merus TaxID=30066 RepID=A0A182V573_ANOME